LDLDLNFDGQPAVSSHQEMAGVEKQVEPVGLHLPLDETNDLGGTRRLDFP